MQHAPAKADKRLLESGFEPIIDLSPTVEDVLKNLDRSLHAAEGRVTGTISPVALALAYVDWAMHLANAPGRRAWLAARFIDQVRRWQRYLLAAPFEGTAAPCIKPLPQDHRFDDPVWQTFPFNIWHQGFLLTQQWWHNAMKGLPGVDRHHETVVTFATRQILDVFSPSNFLLTNPELIKLTSEKAGQNLIQGAINWLEDLLIILSGQRPEIVKSSYKLGRDLAATPGRVVFRNELMELIRYDPVGEKVRAEPVMIVPAWIMKYYILDLSPKNSMARFLCERGFSVYMISWRNPGAEQRDLGLEDYRSLGVMAAISEISRREKGHRIHAVGYCLGGTLLAITAAAIGCVFDNPFATLSLLTTQVDFADPGELQLFVDESEIAFLEDTMWKQGYLSGIQMAGAFQLLRSNDLIWSRLTRLYLRGEREPASDLMFWNADTTRMPYRMQADYLRKLFLNNDLAEGRLEAAGHPVALSNIQIPMFMVGTETDHIAPWKSTYKMHFLTDAELTFVLASGGHNAGVVSEPGHPRRHYRISTRARASTDCYVDPEAWLEAMPKQQGSWWPVWVEWLESRSTDWVTPAILEDGLAQAPGTYVFER